MKTYRTNCIFTFGTGQAYRDLYLPLDMGHDAICLILAGVAEGLRPTMSLTLSVSGTNVEQPTLYHGSNLVKVSMAVTNGIPGANLNDDPELPAWYRACKGKLYFAS